MSAARCELRVGPHRVAQETIRYGAPWMNGSADCDQRSPMATDEEPPGPLDLSSSILSTDFAYDARSVSVQSTVGLGADGWRRSTDNLPPNGSLGQAVLPFAPADDWPAIG